MLNDPLFLLVAFACLAVLVVLMVGIGGFAKGGDFNRKHANRIMRYRIIAQAIAVVLILLFVLIRGGIGGR
ncbi:twin transmembrane helix small protein [Albidovulum sp.]|uniref:twin transmembrane helix small protein n=1 Tax=Albidovulum sp. TaxID=1872424 RepID=UPI001D5832E5|nr:twin transmembrane helix small protein [Paracoccaceae bacterium]MCC0045988.1 twin transmembrane helix small protein [Defluviimonas sp.]HPE23928.1 twin transmembrane helix small protein [Albidovulum sp.]MCB2120909.1 twin transmembrane helix small protein [Paracoccaceae bacterium]MCB2121307.1 twin transmembrane helix small protein [Paracoccaceae bacterium]